MIKNPISSFLTSCSETFGLPRAVAGVILLVLIAGLIATGVWFFGAAPPKIITITCGPAGSSFETVARKYQKNWADKHIDLSLNILNSDGSRENLNRLADKKFKVDVGFVQGGVTNGIDIDKLVSLGSVAYEPLLIFYRSTNTVELLSAFTGKTLAIGPEGSGTRSLALTLLAANEIETNGPTKLLGVDAETASKGLVDGTIDAVFLMGDSASSQVMRELLRTPGIHLFDFTQADGYTRKISYLNKMVLPKGSIDFGKNIPDHDICLIGPTVELVARPNLHPAISDLLLEAAQDVNGNVTLLQRRGEFPAPLEHEFRISQDAKAYYKSGKSFFYRYLPFQLASLVERIMVLFLPTVLLVIPALRLIPAAYRWPVRLRLYRRYRALMVLERSLLLEMTPGKREELIKELDRIEAAVNKMRVPASFADQFYGLRGSIGFVRTQLTSAGRTAGRPVVGTVPSER